jgi:hypothetical protein
LILRCKSCQDSVKAPTPDDRSRWITGTCRGCGRRYEIAIHGSPRRAVKQLFQRARRLAEEDAIDLPSAYSVILGILTLQQVRDLGRDGSTPDPAPPEPDTDRPSRPVRYDPAFGKAVEAGTLTARQAMERGKRDTCAAILAHRHRLSMELAYEVADNRVSLVEAVRESEAREGRIVKVTFRPTGSPLLKGSIAALAALVIPAIWVHWYVSLPPEGSARRMLVGAAEVRTDDWGRVVEVSGPDPVSVLQAYCEKSEPHRRLEPLVLVPSVLPSSTRVRHGLLRDPSDRDTLFSIQIREERERNRWVAGDGEQPLLATRAPSEARKALGDESL